MRRYKKCIKKEIEINQPLLKEKAYVLTIQH